MKIILQKIGICIQRIPWWGRPMILLFAWFGIPAAMGGLELIFFHVSTVGFSLVVMLTPFLVWWRIGFLLTELWELLLKTPPDSLLIASIIAGVILHLTALGVSICFLVKPRFWSLGSLIFLLAVSSIRLLFGLEVMIGV